MWCGNSVNLLFKSIVRNNSLLKRAFFSPAIKCESIWNKRLESPIIKKCNLDNFYYELETKFGQTNNINSVDVDIFVNAAVDSSHLDEIQDLIHKLRLSPDAVNILPSTHHALIRLLLDFNKYEELITILNDRLNYGIFPDDFSNLLMFDRFLKEKDYKNAAKIASFQMLQEDFNHPLIKYLSLYSCHQYLLNPTEWEKPKEESEPEDEEEIKVRVKYLRNPFFDDHFDLTKSDDLIGKTLSMIGKTIDDEIGASYQLLGHILFKKYSFARSLLNSISTNKQNVSKDIFELIMNNLNENLNIEGKENNENPSIITEIKTKCEDLATQKLIKEIDTLSYVENKIKQLVQESENFLIDQQQMIYQNWIEHRDNILSETLDKLKKEERLKKVHTIKEELTKREQELFFFDKEDEMDLEIERKKELKESWIKQDATGVKTKTNSAEYVPPEIEKRKQSSN